MDTDGRLSFSIRCRSSFAPLTVLILVANMPPPIQITADAVNCLIHAYFQDSGSYRLPPSFSAPADLTLAPGFQHSAFVLRAEGRLEHSPNYGKHIPRGELVELLSKALLYTEVEAHWKGNVMTANCKSGFTLLERHVCAPDPTLPATITYDQPPPLSEAMLPSGPPQQPAPALEPPTNGTNGMTDVNVKRKASTPVADEAPAEKRPRTSSSPDENTEVDSIASSTAECTSLSIRL